MVALSCTMSGHQRKRKTVMRCPRRRGRQIPCRSRQGPCLTSATVVTFALFDLDRRCGCGHFAFFYRRWTRRGFNHQTRFSPTAPSVVPLAILLLEHFSQTKNLSLLRPFRTVVTLVRIGVPLPLEIVTRSSIPAGSHRKPLARAPTPNKPTESGHLFPHSSFELSSVCIE